MSPSLLTPSKISAWLNCAHTVTLQARVDAGDLPRPELVFGSFARLLADKGNGHEHDCLATYLGVGKQVLAIPGKADKQSFEDWMAGVGNPLGDPSHDVLYQLPLLHDGIRGVADFVLRVDNPDGSVDWEPLDAKLARKEAKPGHVLQLCFYAEAIEAATGRMPEHVHLWLGSGRVESLRTADFLPYWRRVRSQLADRLAADPATAATAAEPCTHCQFCEFADHCTAEWRDADALHFVAGILRTDREHLQAAGVDTLEGLARHDGPVVGMRAARHDKLVEQARLQVQAREHPDDPVPIRPIPPNDDHERARDLEQLPKPDDGDVFIDYEGHPFWRAETGLFFLFGHITRTPDGGWVYEAQWAEDKGDEAARTRELIEWIAERRAAHPNMHVYHYNHTERSALEALAAEHGADEATLRHLVDSGCFVDLLLIVRNAVQIGAETYSLKAVEIAAGYERGHDIDKGAGAVVEFEEYTKDADPTRLERIAAYNEDDVRATLAVRDWLVSLRAPEMPWRAAVVADDGETPEKIAERDLLVEQLQERFGPGTAVHLLGDLLAYWSRERLAYVTPIVARLTGDPHDFVTDDDVLGGLAFEQTLPPEGKEKWPRAVFTFPPQTIPSKVAAGKSIWMTSLDGQSVSVPVREVDAVAGRLVVGWSERAQELGVVCQGAMADTHVAASPKPETLVELARQVLDPATHGEPNPATMALLRGDPPAFAPGGGPGGEFSDEPAEMRAWVTQLDRTVVPVQGPPGTGKTFRGAQLVHELVSQGQRVGITAFSHKAIDNFLEAVVERFEEEGDLEKLTAARRGGEPPVPLRRTDYFPQSNGNKKCADPKYNVVAGTSWLFANQDVRNYGVDVLIIDEAGQFSLADAVATSQAARSVILLGDPLQLPQVVQAVHPGGAGASALGHLLGDLPTIPTDRGVFIKQSWRMHEDICDFISEQIYEGLLSAHPDNAKISSDHGTGLRWVRAEHIGCSTSSEQEAELVARQVSTLLGSGWVDREGTQHDLDLDEIKVVAAYNDQVDLIRSTLDTDPATAGVQVGTVDKFQGQEAAVIIYSMAASSLDDSPRGADFLLSQQRFNVAISRAKCLAYLVCTDSILNSRAADIETMRLMSTLCAFVERATEP